MPEGTGNATMLQTNQEVPSPEVPKPDPAVERESVLKQREDAIAARERKFADELKKNATEKSGLGAKLTKLSELEKYQSEAPEREKQFRERERQSARLNPKGYLKDLYGDDYYKVITDTEVNGVPPAQLIAAELQKVREEFKAELESREKRASDAANIAEQRELDASRRTVAQNCTAFCEKSAAEYPVFKKLGGPAQVGAMLGQRIEREFMSTGRILTEKEAADGLEGELLSVLEEAVGADKYKERLQGKLKPATVAASSGVQGVPSSTRRTLSNNLTASTTGKAPRPSETERLQRAWEVEQAARRKG